MTDITEKTPDNGDDLADKVELRVDFVLGTAQIDLGQIKSLKPGKTLMNLPDIQLPRVKAMVGNKHIATGNLIDVNGVIGFRITELAK